MRKLLALLAAFSLIGTVSVTALPGIGAMSPVKCDAADVTPDGRVFPEPRYSATFLTFADFECGIDVLEDANEDRIEVDIIGRSASDHPIYNVKVTDESIPESEKQHLLILSSIHGNEHAGREGGARVIEDMVDARFRAGDGFVQDVMDRYVVHFVFPNPDGWVNGVITGENDAGVNFTRGNNGGRDLNRNFEVQGYLRASNGTVDQPEGQAITALLAQHADLDNDPTDPDYRGWSFGTDNHGQGVKPVAASGLQIVGQFDFNKSERLAFFADSIAENMQGEALEAIEALNQATGGAIEPYEWGTLYDILGYSAAGSGIDYYNSPANPLTRDAQTQVVGVGVEGTGFATEMTGSNLPFSNILTHPAEVNQMWVETVRAINFAMFKAAVEDPQFTFPVGTRAAYVFDPATTSSSDEDGFGLGNAEMPGNFTGFDSTDEYVPYEVSRMRFFTDLNATADAPLDAVRVPDVLSGAVDLTGYESLVLADTVTPEGDQAAWLTALADFVDGGGNLILTDQALNALPSLVDGITAEQVTMVKRNVGYADFVAGHPLNTGLRGVASQTYDVIPIGYPDNSGAAPNWRVASSAVTAAGGSVAGTNGSGQAIYGEIPKGEGTIRFIGALLPEPTEEFFHPYGLQNYAVTYTGYTLLENMLASRS